MGKKAYMKPRLIPVGKIEEWVKRDETICLSNNVNDRNGPSDKGQKIDDLLFKLDTQGLKKKIIEELEK